MGRTHRRPATATGPAPARPGRATTAAAWRAAGSTLLPLRLARVDLGLGDLEAGLAFGVVGVRVLLAVRLQADLRADLHGHLRQQAQKLLPQLLRLEEAAELFGEHPAHLVLGLLRLGQDDAEHLLGKLELGGEAAKPLL